MMCCLFLGCLLPNGRLLKVGEQYANDQCTRLCTCKEDATIHCIALCPAFRPTLCPKDVYPPMVQMKVRVPAGPPQSKCTCEQITCVKKGMYSNYSSLSNVQMNNYKYIHSIQNYVSLITSCMFGTEVRFLQYTVSLSYFYDNNFSHYH